MASQIYLPMESQIHNGRISCSIKKRAGSQVLVVTADSLEAKLWKIYHSFWDLKV